MSKKFYTNYFKWGNKVYFRGYKEIGSTGQYEPFIDNEMLNDCRLYTLPNSSSEKTSCRLSFYGNRPLVEHRFKTPKEAHAFIRENKDYNKETYGYPKFENIKISDIFIHQQPITSYIKILYFDIETYVGIDTDNGQLPKNMFPDILDSEHEINLITSIVNNTIYVYSTKQIDKSYILDKLSEFGYSNRYKLKEQCLKTEKELLERWSLLLKKENPDIISGWNINGFDIPYIHSRMEKYFDDEQIADLLSPFGIITKRIGKDNFGNQVKIVDIKGISALDYIDVYKKFELSPRPNYKLDTIASIELGVGKLEYEGTFRDFYRNFFATDFALYNIIDVIRVQELERTCGFFGVVFEMSYETLCNFIDTLSVTRLWDNILYVTLKENNVELPSFGFNESHDGFEGAFVKPTIPGYYEFLVTFDVGSLNKMGH